MAMYQLTPRGGKKRVDNQRQQKTGEAMAMYHQMDRALAAILLGSVHISLREIVWVHVYKRRK